MPSWESLLIDEYVHPKQAGRPVVDKPVARTSRWDQNDGQKATSQEAYMPPPFGRKSRSNTFDIDGQSTQTPSKRPRSARGGQDDCMSVGPTPTVEENRVSHGKAPKQMLRHKRPPLAILPNRQNAIIEPTRSRVAEKKPKDHHVVTGPSNTHAGEERTRSSPRKVLWPTGNMDQKWPRNAAFPLHQTGASPSRFSQAYRPRCQPSPLKAKSAASSRRMSVINEPPMPQRSRLQERDNLSLAEQRYHPRSQKQLRVLCKGICTDLTTSIADTKNAGMAGEEQQATPEIRRPSLKELMIEKLPQSPPTLHAHDSILAPNPGSPRASSIFKASVTFERGSDSALGDLQKENNAKKVTMRKLLRWEIWLYRIGFSVILLVLNISLLIVYLFAPRHHYLLAFLVFMKSKDLLSTVAGILGSLWRSAHDLIWKPQDVDSKWIMSLVCAYAESDVQIMKTVDSLVRQDLVQHKQVICVVLDGKPRDVLSRFTRITHMMRRPYQTWKSVPGELQIHAGFINSVPIILIQKVQNAGKKDTLILGHTLFNYPRDDAPIDIKLLRRDLFTHILPTLTGVETFKAFDAVYATDADSVIHQDCLKQLVNALSRNKHAIAACGIIIAELENSSEWSAWHLFQQFQYTFGQYVRRQAESVWGRVTCLPGPVTMVAVRPEMASAISDYAAPITNANLFRHQVQYQGTDRRLTWCMLSQGTHLRTVLVTSAIGETVVPSTLDHYLSQRRRWAANAYFNDYMYAFGRQQMLITRLFGLIDIVRMSFVYYRVMNTALFVRSLARNFYWVKIIPTLILTKSPTTWFLLLILIKEPVLRKRFHKIVCGILLNQVMSPVLSVIVFSRVLLNMGNHAWGKTGVNSKDSRGSSMVYLTPSTPSSPWSPRKLVSIIKNAVHPARAQDISSSVGNDRSTSSSAPSTRAPTIHSKPSSISSSSEDMHAVRTAATPRTPSTVTLSSSVTPNHGASSQAQQVDVGSTTRRRTRRTSGAAPL